MPTNPDNLTTIQATIDSKKVNDIVLDGLQEILPHIQSASMADIMMAYAVMIKSTLIGMELTEAEKSQAIALFNEIYPKVLVEQVGASRGAGMALH